MIYNYNELITLFNKDNIYFNGDYVKSKNCLMNLFLSDRSDGKTTYCKISAFLDFYFKNQAHVYVRRYESELSQIMKKSFLNKLLRMFPFLNELCEFKQDNIGVLAKRIDRDEDFKYMIYYIPISKSARLKSQIEDERITQIDFDEYISLDNRYLKNEMNYCLELYKTCDRDRNKVQFNFYGNKISSFCPFFDFFDLTLTIQSDKIRYYRNNTIAVQIYKSKILKEKRDKSSFSEMVKNTEYDEYNQGGILFENDFKKDNIANANYIISFRSKRGTGSVWEKNEHYIISCKNYGNGVEIVDGLYNTERESINCLAPQIQRTFKHAYKINNMFFESERAFYLFEPILRKINIY